MEGSRPDSRSNHTQPGVHRCLVYHLTSFDGLSMSRTCFDFHPQIRIYLTEYTSCRNLISTHNVTRLLDEAMTPAEVNELEAAEAVCRRFLEWDLDNFDCEEPGGVKARLAEVLGIKDEKDADGQLE